ncbi:hypothetical protein E0485_11765 [Paenibacillus albiflavus]|uniref:Uncharacterized protein n=1 Tax=Paenibacillus albiflavus TaxID=2545760 RepID=A0A4R4EB88_9BACL|nr:hypothetical protein [Paenibacillus albiflavus]TCZ77134.1 hypothetical protein E0485_11765 [Paenibacillus albiflavus]
MADSHSTQVMSSFVLRFSPLEDEDRADHKWRIRITHVQNQDEVTVSTLQDAMNYIDDALKRG